MSELARVLRPGGWAVLQVPISLKLRETLEEPALTDPSERNTRFGDPAHVRLYAKDYGQRLSDAGLDVALVDPLQTLGARSVARYALLPAEQIYLCRR